jgi:hypothetical protein
VVASGESSGAGSYATEVVCLGVGSDEPAHGSPVTWLKTENGDKYILEIPANLPNVLDQQMYFHNQPKSEDPTREPLPIKECFEENRKIMAAILSKSGKSGVAVYYGDNVKGWPEVLW